MAARSRRSTATLPRRDITALPPHAPTVLPRRGRAAPLASLRCVAALVLREMATTYGRSVLGYLWAVLEPVAGILLLTFLCSLALRAPALGSSFALFYASGLLPLMAFLDVSRKLSVALRFSRPLLFYPRVTWLDALLARLLLNALTQALVMALVLAGILWLHELPWRLDPAALGRGAGEVLVLAAGVGTLNCYLVTRFPGWERTWAVLTRPLLLVSCVLFLYADVPHPYREWLWWNPLVHPVGEFRRALYAGYPGLHVSGLYPLFWGLATLCLGLALLHRGHRQLLER